LAIPKASVNVKMLQRILSLAESFFGGQLPVDFHCKVPITNRTRIEQELGDITDKLEGKKNVILCVTEDLIQAVDGLFFFENTKCVHVGGPKEHGVHGARITDDELSQFHVGLTIFLDILEKYGAIPSFHRDLQDNLTEKMTAEWIDKHPLWPNRPAIVSRSSIPLKLAAWTSSSKGSSADVVVQFKGARGDWSYPETFFTGGAQLGEVKTMATDLGFMGGWPSRMRLISTSKDGWSFWKLVVTAPNGKSHVLMLAPDGEDGEPSVDFQLDPVSTEISIPPSTCRTARDAMSGSGVWMESGRQGIDGKELVSRSAGSAGSAGVVSGQIKTPRQDQVTVVVLANGATAFLQPYAVSPKAGVLALSTGWCAYDDTADASPAGPLSSAGFAKPAYKVVQGVCHLMGVADGRLGGTVATLPESCWPTKRLVFHVTTGDSAAAGGSSGGSSGKSARLDVTTAGELVCYGPGKLAAFLSLDGISFAVRGAPAGICSIRMHYTHTPHTITPYSYTILIHRTLYIIHHNRAADFAGQRLADIRR
jgi:hypothetical protein